MYKIVTACLFLLLAFNTSQANDWKLSSDKGGIKVYTRLVPGSKVKAIKVECDLKATASQLVAVLLDVKTCADWVYHTKSCVLVKQVSPAELYYYSEISVPWPAENRDFVAHIAVTQDPETKVVTVDAPSVPGHVAVKKGVVRISNSKGKWTITPIANQSIRVEYSLQVDPGGVIPAWLVNMFATEGPVQSFKSLKLQLQKDEYKNVSLPFIRN
ncbi:MAG: lipid-binding protein [Sphingobacteriaceae bacterium]|nr:MAG: lipid-binding protein [Sphingobacteriaceae bacterium]